MTLWAAAQRGDAGQRYLACDDEPAPLGDVARFAADLLGLSLPEGLDDEQAAALDSSVFAMLTASKRLRNPFTSAALGVSLRYPTFRQGLTALAASDRNQLASLR